ncbi:MAG: hypothetical protein FWD36_06970 [Treponema sp.]|nr:hypothetical protein [Treponema sp.]
MTLSDRNLAFKLGIAFSFLCLLICVAASIKVIPVYTVMEAEITRRSESSLPAFLGQFSAVQLLAAHSCILALVLYAFCSIIFIYYFFEKTQSPEILFVAFFAVSSSLEALRLILPLQWVYEIPSLYLLMASRIILFGRYFGIFSLFIASVYAVGFKTQRQRNVVMILVVITSVIALGSPIDTAVWDSSLNMMSGYISTFRLIEIGTFLITTVSFFIASWARSSREFIFIGTGSILAFLGRTILFGADTWVGLPIGLVLLVVGTWLICIRLHKVYLWL